jgi:hypothetical protein
MILKHVALYFYENICLKNHVQNMNPYSKKHTNACFLMLYPY